MLLPADTLDEAEQFLAVVEAGHRRGWVTAERTTEVRATVGVATRSRASALIPAATSVSRQGTPPGSPHP